jgi:hypothetical protein
MNDEAIVKERPRPGNRPIDDLIGQDDGPGRQIFSQAPDGAKAQEMRGS